MIQYTFTEVKRPPFFDAVETHFNDIITQLFKQVSLVDYIFCSDEFLLEINKSVLNHDYYTDIITFDLRDNAADPLEAEIYISLDRVEENSRQFNTTFAREIQRVMVHGLLHLTGLNDSSEEEKAHMRAMEEQYIIEI